MKNILLFLFVLCSAIVQSQELSSFLEKTNTFLEKYVANGLVAYSTIYEDQNDLKEILELAESINTSEMNPDQYQAFWINAYNLAVIKGIIDNYPTNSPLSHDGFFDKTTYSLGGTKLTLNTIEHEILRAKFKDPRFHFVLVCGAMGCPPIVNKAYMPMTLNKQLDKQTGLALNGNFLKVNVKKKRVEASEILKWYKEDFTMNGSEIDFINQYRSEKIPENYKLTYFTYNWNLNKQ